MMEQTVDRMETEMPESPTSRRTAMTEDFDQTYLLIIRATHR